MPARVSTVDRDAVLRQIRYAHVELSAVRTLCGKRHKTAEFPSVCLSRRSSAAAAPGGFAAEVGRGQQISIDGCCCRATCGPRKFWSDCKEVQHNCTTPLFRYSSPGRGVKYCDEHVCLCVCRTVEANMVIYALTVTLISYCYFFSSPTLSSFQT